MVDFNEVIEKLKDIISSKKIGGKVFDKDVAAELGIAQATFATMKKRGSIPYREIMEFCARRKISINWLFFDQPAEMLVEETGKFFRVRYFADIRASAGGGAEVFDEGYEYLEVDRTIMENLVGPLPSGEIEAIHVEGESMEPTLPDGSIVFIDRRQTDPAKDGIFVAATGNGLFVKRIRRRADGMVELISDNPLYTPEVLPPEQVEIVGRVVGNIERL
ncbi:helix-turn-helix transcriptional regulator [Nitratifractor sp.]|uniref:LexA family transcriptional regulator n=1 Tax=Nitratifractor sp. TaxID=2268144 RepID=UPI0025D0A51A|nr:helix-turn-helix transcriptional regulator [Nitratifractor sp.]